MGARFTRGENQNIYFALILRVDFFGKRKANLVIFLLCANCIFERAITISFDVAASKVSATSLDCIAKIA
jgi:hypothetical protein